MKKKLSRSEARCEAFKIIFSLNQHKDDVDFLFENLAAELPASVTSMPYIKSTVLGILEKEDELLEIISNNLADGWRLDRISKVAKSILLLAVYEIKYAEDVPTPVAINEAVELSKKYDEPDSSAFVNGVLAGVVK
ncbi:MAG: transcription antitermination factor NusB [Ruminococcaceae bacterium]|nr:transcription antitermination factor NusB [Oscillospiraceae bacterium]